MQRFVEALEVLDSVIASGPFPHARGIRLSVLSDESAVLAAIRSESEFLLSHERVNTVFGPCLIRRVQAPGDTVSERLFRPIIEREGRYKFVSLANKL